MPKMSTVLGFLGTEPFKGALLFIGWVPDGGDFGRIAMGGGQNLFS